MKVKEFSKQVVDDFKGYRNHTERRRYRNVISALVLREIESWTNRQIRNHLGIAQSTVQSYFNRYELPKEFPIWYKAFKINGYVPYGIEEYKK